ncbi:hypothetical protein D3C74_393770 [compost metagenome]
MKNQKLIPIIIDLDDWLKSDDASESFADYVSMIADKPNVTTLIINSLILEVEMYLPTDIIYTQTKECIQAFADIAMSGNEIEFMRMYLDLCIYHFNLNDKESKTYIDSNLTLSDIRDNYNVLSIQELVERYKDKKFFAAI